MRYAIGDTETTGLHAPRAVEIAFIEIDPITLEIENSWESLLDPEKEISEGAMQIHGITQAMVEDAPTMQEYLEHMLKDSVAGEWTLIGHNISYDRPMFEEILDVRATYCTLALSRRLFPTGPANHKLGTMKEYLGLEGGEAHRAMGDVLTVHQMLKALLPQTGKSLLDHLQVPAHTIYTMPFGEHQGKALADIPRAYRTWLLSRKIDDDLRRSLMQLRNAGI